MPGNRYKRAFLSAKKRLRAAEKELSIITDSYNKSTAALIAYRQYSDARALRAELMYRDAYNELNSNKKTKCMYEVISVLILSILSFLVGWAYGTYI